MPTTVAIMATTVDHSLANVTGSTLNPKYVWEGPVVRCNASDEFWAACEGMFVSTYYVLTPIYILFALSGNSLCLFICYKESKKEGAYFYQIFCLCSELWQSISIGFHYTLCGFYGVFGMERTGAASDAFRSSYTLMWIWAHYTSPMFQGCETTSLLLSICAVIDRVLAVLLPFRYKNWNHKRIQSLCCFICVITGLGSSVYDAFRPLIVVDNRGLYIIQLDLEYMSSSFVLFSNQFRNDLRIIGLVILVLSNAMLLYLFHKKFMGKKNKVAATNDKKQNERKESEKTLIILSAYQSVANILDMSASVTYYFMLYLSGFPTCLMFLMWPVMDFTVAVATGFDFYMLVLINKRFRDTAMKHIFRRKGTNDTRTVPVSSHMSVHKVTATDRNTGVVSHA